MGRRAAGVGWERGSAFRSAIILTIGLVIAVARPTTADSKCNLGHSSGRGVFVSSDFDAPKCDIGEVNHIASDRKTISL